MPDKAADRERKPPDLEVQQALLLSSSVGQVCAQPKVPGLHGPGQQDQPAVQCCLPALHALCC